MSTTNLRLGAALYFALQGASGLGWWAVLLLFPASRELFWLYSPGGFDGRGLLAFALPDAIGFVALSLACAWALWRRSDAAWTLLCLLAGALGYATLFCVNLALVSNGETILPALLMSPALGATVFWMLKLRPALFGGLRN